MSMCQSPLSPETPSPREVDAMLRNTFGGTPSPLSQMCGHGGSRAEWGSQVSEVFDTLSTKMIGGDSGEGEKCGENNDMERERTAMCSCSPLLLITQILTHFHDCVQYYSSYACQCYHFLARYQRVGRLSM